MAANGHAHRAVRADERPAARSASTILNSTVRMGSSSRYFRPFGTVAIETRSPGAEERRVQSAVQSRRTSGCEVVAVAAAVLMADLAQRLHVAEAGLPIFSSTTSSFARGYGGVAARALARRPQPPGEWQPPGLHAHGGNSTPGDAC